VAKRQAGTSPGNNAGDGVSGVSSFAQRRHVKARATYTAPRGRGAGLAVSTYGLDPSAGIRPRGDPQSGLCVSWTYGQPGSCGSGTANTASCEPPPHWPDKVPTPV
jgi:hypothetical protein